MSGNDEIKKGVSSGWWAAQALVVGLGSIYLAATSSAAWLICIIPAIWMGFRARRAATRSNAADDWGPRS